MEYGRLESKQYKKNTRMVQTEERRYFISPDPSGDDKFPARELLPATSGGGALF